MSSTSHWMLNQVMILLKEKCITDITDPPGTNCTRVDEVVLRKQEDPTARISVVVQHFDPIKKEGWTDMAVGGSTERPTDGLHYPARWIGGAFDRLRMTIMVRFNLTASKEDDDEADIVVCEVLSRIKWALRTNSKRLTGFQDSYGEVITRFEEVADIEYDSGASGSFATTAFIRCVAIAESKRS